MPRTPPAPRVDLDHNATAPLLPAARAAMLAALDGPARGGNPSSPHAAGHAARLVLEGARAEVAALLGARASDIIFVSGGTEADNLAVAGLWRARAGASPAGASAARAPSRIVTTSIEHPAVLEPCRRLAQEEGADLVAVACRADGSVDAGEAARALAPGAALASIMLANNETGVVQPVHEIAAAAAAAGVPLHTDA
ncbi:MAG TPA: aminotransferase class V-fold PLP-dependent enzyme, partial [Candidatus Polarisedimenticolia bacterium]|nr:aminotransferase class V-fold PLP-dependent enzyme [Candidatus Polarisedimenticolia bacterium]